MVETSVCPHLFNSSPALFAFLNSKNGPVEYRRLWSEFKTMLERSLLPIIHHPTPVCMHIKVSEIEQNNE